MGWRDRGKGPAVSPLSLHGGVVPPLGVQPCFLFYLGVAPVYIWDGEGMDFNLLGVA